MKVEIKSYGRKESFRYFGRQGGRGPPGNKPTKDTHGAIYPLLHYLEAFFSFPLFSQLSPFVLS